MKRLIPLTLSLLLMLSGCGSQEEISMTIPPVAPNAVISEEIRESPTDLAAVSVPATTEHYVLEDGNEIFSYTTQHMELILPNSAVADRVIINFLNRIDAGKSDAEQILASAQEDCIQADTFYPYFYHTIYSPTRIDHQVLSLSGTQNSYSGGLHGNLSCISANYDLQTGDVLTLGSIMAPDATTEDFILLILDKLRPQIEELYLYEDYEAGVRNRLDTDENQYEDFYFTSNGLCFYFAPYEIAPYTSGIITVELPYQQIADLIYEGYLLSEKSEMEGTMLTGDFMTTDMEQFSNMAEVTLTAGEQIMVAYPVGSVEDIRIHVSGDGMNIPDYTVFAAYEMTDLDAVVISLRQEDISRISVSYYDGKETQRIPLV